MKTQPHRRPNGFTLIELLIVVVIIAVLAGTGFTVFTSAVNKAKRATALETIGTIESGISRFHMDYSRMPKEITTDTEIDSEDAAFLNVMLGLEGDRPDKLNTRSFKYLRITEGTAKKGGLVYNSDSTAAVGLYDPWGGTYKILLDGDLDEVINPSPAGGGGRQLTGRRSAVWSNGPDGVDGGGSAADDVKTWK